MPANPDQVSYSQIFQQLNAAANRLKSIHRLTVQQADLTPSQYYILKLLWEKDKRPFKDLAEELICSRATITGIVDNLEKKGLLRREINLEDRRSILAALTEKGLALKSSTPDVSSIFSSCCSGLSNQEFRQLGILLKKLNKSLDCQPPLLPVDIDVNRENVVDQMAYETIKE